MTTESTPKFVPGPWELDSAKDGDSTYQIIHGQLPLGIKGDYGYPVCDTMNRHFCISPDEDRANARLIAAAPDMLEALERICAEAESWHSVHGHSRDSVQCDSICQLIPEMQRAIHLAKGEPSEHRTTHLPR